MLRFASPCFAMFWFAVFRFASLLVAFLTSSTKSVRRLQLLGKSSAQTHSIEQNHVFSRENSLKIQNWVLWGAFLALLGCSWGALGRSWAALGLLLKNMTFFDHFWSDFCSNLAPFWSPEWHQNRSKNRPKTMTQNEMQQIPLQDLIRTVFDRFGCAPNLKNRAPAKEISTFLKNHCFASKLLKNRFWYRFWLPKCLPRAPFWSPKSSKRRS